MPWNAIIIGAGPAGLTAAHELLKSTDIKPIIYEMSCDIGGISKTKNYKGNRIDIGGHRFFSKSSRVMNWWHDILPQQNQPSCDDLLLGRRFQESADSRIVDPETSDQVMLLRRRLSRIFFLRTFLDYPITLNWRTLRNLGWYRAIRIGFSYLHCQWYPIKEECTLADFLINRFGKELYCTFFRDYTEKVWGVPCVHIPADWGAQRIKGLSIAKTMLHAFRSRLAKDQKVEQKKTETSLIDQFLYPKLGPGQLWEEVARRVVAMGGEIHLQRRIVGVSLERDSVKAVTLEDTTTGERVIQPCDYLFSSMPIKELIAAMPSDSVPANVQEVAQGLIYRDFVTVGLLLRRLRLKNETRIRTLNDVVPDNWIYIQERDVKIGRLQIFNNWSPYLVEDRNNVWIGLEYFCNEGDALWGKADDDFISFAIDELVKIDIIARADVIDATLLRVLKAYPAYFGTYRRFDELRRFTDCLVNLFLVGRNGMHRYNNTDHSMLTAMVAVENIKNGVATKQNIWEVNTEEEYLEQ